MKVDLKYRVTCAESNDPIDADVNFSGAKIPPKVPEVRFCGRVNISEKLLYHFFFARWSSPWIRQGLGTQYVHTMVVVI